MFSKNKTKFIILLITFAVSMVITKVFFVENASAVQFTVSPMNQMKVITPGETEQGSLIIANPAANTEAAKVVLEIRPFSYNEDNDPIFEAKEDYSQIVNWITLSGTEYSLEPNESIEVPFTIDVPQNAPAGGQYASIIVRGEEGTGGMFNEYFEIAHLIYAEVAGETVRRGDITNVNVPSFLLSGNITGSAMIKNTGNVHSNATHTMKIFPLFSNEEVFTNEENPQTNLIMPGSSRLTSVTWAETPSIGIFHVLYDVEFEGVKNSVDKYIIICPLWLLFLILLAIFLIIFRILSAKKKTREA